MSTSLSSDSSKAASINKRMFFDFHLLWLYFFIYCLERCYLHLPLSNSGTMRSTHVHWANRVAEDAGRDVSPMVIYEECRDFDFETFGVVEKILHRSYVHGEKIHNAKECLDYFGPVHHENMLVLRSVEGKGESGGDEETGRVSKKTRAEQPSRYTTRSKSKAKEASSTEPQPEAFYTFLIVCESEARTRAVMNATSALGNKNYVPFKMLFVEEVLEERMGIDISAVNMPMMPAAIFLGDHNNIFYLRKICRKKSIEKRSFQEIHAESNLFRKFLAAVMNSILSNVQPGGIVDFFKGGVQQHITCFKDNGYGLNIKVGIQAAEDIKHTILCSCLAEPYDMLAKDRGLKTLYLPGMSPDEHSNESDYSCSLFHRN